MPSIIGIDLGKNWFHLIGLDADGVVVLSTKLNRRQLTEFAATTPACVIAMEACAGSQYWGRVFAGAGHEVRILPEQFVRPYLQASKNDFHDAAAIVEAGHAPASGAYRSRRPSNWKSRPCIGCVNAWSRNARPW